VKIIYCAYGRAGLECLYALLNNFNINLSNIIVFTHDRAENNEFLRHLKSLRIDFYLDSVNNYYEQLSIFNADILISAYYRNLIGNNIIELVKGSAINLHPSILPKYRGALSSVWAILNGEKFTGITIHYMTDKFDEGKIIYQEKIPINKFDTAFSLYNKLVTLFAHRIPRVVNILLSGAPGDTQLGDASYYSRELPFNGILHFSEVTYSESERFVRALYFPPFEGAKFISGNGDIIKVSNIDDLDQYRPQMKK
jgi:methionyl-tRNA formyltransferase